MKIGIHALAAFQPQRTGVEEYSWQLLRHMGEVPEADKHSFVLYRPRSLAARPSPHDRYIVRDLPDAAFWTQRELSRALAREKPDVLFVPAHVLPRSRPQKSVVTVHGVEWREFPQGYGLAQREYLDWFTKEAARVSHRIIVPSEATKQDVMSNYRIPGEKIAVIPHGPPEPLHAERAMLEESLETHTHDPFFVFLGRLERKKNVLGILQAFAMFREECRLPYHLFLAGPTEGYGSDEIFAYLNGSSVREVVHATGFVDEVTKWFLVSRAAALLLPSWYEGFGFPILEAQAAGTPVITSHTSSMPEVGGGGALYVNPANPHAIAEAMFQVVVNAPLRREIVRRGYENLQRFSWDAAARKTLEVLVE